MKPYKPIEGPQLRRKLLREVTRTTPRLFSASNREARAAIAKAFEFEPLSHLTSTEKDHLKKSFKITAIEISNKRDNRVQALLTGKAKRNRTGGRPAEKLDRIQIANLFSRGRWFDTFRITEPDYTGPISNTSRGLKAYSAYTEFDFLKEVNEMHAAKKRKIRVLDVGCATARALSELRRKMRKKVETHGISPEDEPRHPVDHYHILLAEHLPKEFKERFDIVVSHRALEYASFPHIGLRNIVAATAPGGKAVVQFQAGSLFKLNTKIIEDLKVFFEKNKPHLTREARALVKQGMQLKNSEVTEDEVEKQIEDDITHYKTEAHRTIAWLNEVAKMQADPGLKVKIKQWFHSPVGYAAPSLLHIEKISTDTVG